MSAGNAHDIQFEAQLTHELLLLMPYLLYQGAAHSTHSTYKEIEHLILTQKERIVYHIECLAQVCGTDDE